VTSGGQTHAFIYSGGVMTDMGTLGGNNSQALGINASGEVVGVADLSSNSHAFSYTTAGGMVDLGTLGGFNSQANAINNSGVITGYSSVASGHTHAFSYNGTMTDLGTMGGSLDSTAYGINNSGVIVGQSNNHMFSYSGGVYTDLGNLPGQAYAGASDINSAGEIVGASQAPSSSDHAVSYTTAGGMVDLGTIGGGTISTAKGINDLGDIVGDSQNASGQNMAFIYDGGVMYDLTSLLDSSGAGWVLTAPSTAAGGINDLGQIVGTGTDPLGQLHAYLLTPVPEPTSMALLVGGAGALGVTLYRRRRS